MGYLHENTDWREQVYSSGVGCSLIQISIKDKACLIRTSLSSTNCTNVWCPSIRRQPTMWTQILITMNNKGEDIYLPLLGYFSLNDHIYFFIYSLFISAFKFLIILENMCWSLYNRGDSDWNRFIIIASLFKSNCIYLMHYFLLSSLLVHTIWK